MTFNTRVLGVGLLLLSAFSIALAVALGFVAVQQGWPKERAIAMTAVLAVAAEASFWTGGGMLGISFLRRRKGAFAFIARRFDQGTRKERENAGE